MVLNRVNADLLQAGNKLGKVRRMDRRRNNNDFRGAEIERYAGSAFTRFGITRAVLLYAFDQVLAQGGKRCEFSHVQAGQSLPQSGLAQFGKDPVCEVVRESFLNEVMLFECSKGVLKN